MQIDSLRTADGQELYRVVGGQWVACETPHAPAHAGAGGGEAAPSLSLGNNCTEKDPAKVGETHRKSYNAKRKEVVSRHVRQAVRQWGLERCIVFTLTFPDRLRWTNPEDWKTAKRRWHSFRTHVLPGVFLGGVGVWEPSPTGRIHLHAVVGTREDVRTGFDFDAFGASCREFSTSGESPEFKRLRSAYASTATESLRAIWAEIRAKAPDYKIGRCESIPVRSEAGFARYVGKYLGKEDGGEWVQGFKGRRVTVWGEFRAADCMAFTWCRRLSGLDWKLRGHSGDAVGQSAQIDPVRAGQWAAVYRGDVEDRSGFRSIIGELRRQGMHPSCDWSRLRKMFGRGWAWKLLRVYGGCLRECERDMKEEFEATGCAPFGRAEDRAAAWTVKKLHLDSFISGECQADTSSEAVATILREFGGVEVGPCWVPDPEPARSPSDAAPGHPLGSEWHQVYLSLT